MILEKERKAIIDRAHVLPVRRQTTALNIFRGRVYYVPRAVSAGEFTIMRRLDELHFEFPVAGSRMHRGLLAGEGIKIGRRRVRTYMEADGHRDTLLTSACEP
jgi:putative transposase